MINLPIPDPSTTGHPAVMPRKGKVNEFMNAAIMYAFLPIVVQYPNFWLCFTLGVEDGCRIFGGAGFRYCKIVCKQNYIFITPKKIYSKRFVEGFSVARGSSYLATVSI
jgi:hypothetical protein